MKYHILYEHNDGRSISGREFEVDSELDLQLQENESFVMSLAQKDSVNYHKEGTGSIVVLSVRQLSGG